jgi:DNA-binding transcriptional ArsR family regulator
MDVDMALDEKDFVREAEILKTLGHPIRLKIIEGLMRDELLCVKNIWTALGLPQATVSQHLALLKNKQIVSAERKGVTMCYSVADATVVKLMKVLKGNSTS